jgi:hypothetical protein
MQRAHSLGYFSSVPRFPIYVIYLYSLRSVEDKAVKINILSIDFCLDVITPISNRFGVPTILIYPLKVFIVNECKEFFSCR